jgi:rubrerythrin
MAKPQLALAVAAKAEGAQLQPRRRCLRGLVGLGLAASGVTAVPVVRAAGYPATIAAMHAARAAETRVVFAYTEYAQRASQEGYRGIAYLFAACAASESVHGSNFGQVLTRLGEELPVIPRPMISVRATRDNLIAGARGEIHSIETFYPRLLEQLKPEGFEDAINAVQFAWAAEQQHRDKMASIQRLSVPFFERVARAIDDKTGQYFVCRFCGSTMNVVPADTCPVCKNPSSHYRRIEPPA